MSADWSPLEYDCTPSGNVIVLSESGRRYTTTPDGGCTCEGALHGRLCKHVRWRVRFASELVDTLRGIHRTEDEIRTALRFDFPEAVR